MLYYNKLTTIQPQLLVRVVTLCRVPKWVSTITMTSPLDLTKVRLQASGDKRMIESLKRTVRTAGVRGLFDGISGTWMRQMSYSVCRFWAYDESKKLIGATCQCHITSLCFSLAILNPSSPLRSILVIPFFDYWD